MEIGDRVSIGGARFGTIKYIGPVNGREGKWVGVELDSPEGRNDGSVNGYTDLSFCV